MHNLGLGGLEFNPTHTIDEHRPVGFKLLNVIEDAEPSQNNPTSTENGAELAQITDTTTTQYETLSKDDEFIEADDSTNGNVFRLMHDPKHRHPRHHGWFPILDVSFHFIV
jgi:zinc transporter 5